MGLAFIVAGIKRAPVMLILHAALAAAQPAVADYSRPDTWLARPGLDSPAQLVPSGSGYRDLQQWAHADAFYVHPTTGMRSDLDNVPIDDAQALALGRLMLAAQATPFNGVARIYAPRYQQVSLHVFQRTEADMQAPLDLAYEDVRRAFLHFVKHDGEGRPFFLVAHSQGSNHALRLLVEEIAGTELADRLVAAYLPGMPTPRAFFERHLPGIPPCSTAGQTGCVAVWGVFAEGYRGFAEWEALNVYWDPSVRRWVSARGMALVNVNPVSWELGPATAQREAHLGAVPFGVRETAFSGPLRGLVSARNEHGYTIVAPAPLPADSFNDGGVFEEGNYHVFDIGLFWADIRANARQRLVAYLDAENRAGPLIEGPVAVSLFVGMPSRVALRGRSASSALHAEGLPPGLKLDAARREISGVPERPGGHVVVLSANEGEASDIAELVIIVKEEPAVGLP